MNTNGETDNVVHEEEDFPVLHVSGPKSEDYDDDSEDLERVNVLSESCVGDLVCVDQSRYVNDAVPNLT